MVAAANSASSLPLFDCKPPPGLHLDAVKGDKLIEKLIIDEKKYYLFGRNPDLCDFTLTTSLALQLKRVFLLDSNRTQGTFLGHIRLEPHKPQQIPIDSTVSFSASTRVYTLPEKPQTLPTADDELKGLLGLPEEEAELDNLTEFNTAHNKQISTLTIEEGNLDIQRPKRKRKNSRVTFSEDHQPRGCGSLSWSQEAGTCRTLPSLEDCTLPPTHNEASSQPPGTHGTALISGLPMPHPNLAPEVDLTPVVPSAVNMNPTPNPAVYNPAAVNEPKKKKYAKEAWPGKKPTPSLLI
uniref:Nuclear inhibitor of protein phosphatase 1 pseudogene n=1 Tax=Jaculus jaculus TaxID=51337 RepID=A0A8C5P3C7_JACJA